MIRIKYDRDRNSTVVLTQDLTPIYNHLPINIKMKNIITDEIHFDEDMGLDGWIQASIGEMITDILIYSSNGELLEEHKWEVSNYGDDIEKVLWYYLKGRKALGLKSNGLVIGTHDGRFGHWIYPVKHQLTDCVLVEGGKKQFDKLVGYYTKFDNVKFKNEIVTSDGRDVIWYEGGEGYSDTVVKGMIENFVINEPIHQSNRKSVSLDEIIGDNNFDWIHLDVEGLDAELILSLKIRPNIIIYESMNLSDRDKRNLDEWFSDNQYSTITHKENTVAFRKVMDKNK